MCVCVCVWYVLFFIIGSVTGWRNSNLVLYSALKTSILQKAFEAFIEDLVHHTQVIDCLNFVSHRSLFARLVYCSCQCFPILFVFVYMFMFFVYFYVATVRFHFFRR